MSNQPCPRCGKQNPADIHTCTPLALKLAEELLDGMSDEHWSQLSADAAAELRRLHAENEAAHAVGIRQEQELMDCEAQRDELLAALRELLADYDGGIEPGESALLDKARAAIAKVEGGAA